MSEYIDRQALLDAIPPTKEDKQISLYGAVADFISLVCDVPAADVVPVVHGEWIDGSEMPKPKCGKSKYKDDKQYCSNCCREMFHWKAVIYPSKYCPNCGAKMDGRGKK